MEHPYVIRRKPDKSGEEKKVLYYAVPKVNKQSKSKELAEIIHSRSTYTEGDIPGAPGKVEARRVCFKTDPSLRKALKKFEFKHEHIISKK